MVGERALGTLSVLTKTRRAFSEEEEELLELFAAKAATALENARLFRRAEQRAERLTALSTLTRLITQAADSGAVYDEVARAATMFLGGRMSRVWIDDPAARVFRIQGMFSVDSTLVDLATEYSTIAYGIGFVGAVHESRAPEYVADIQQDARFMNKRLAREADFHATAVIPLVKGERVVGLLMVFFGWRGAFTDEEKALMQLLADQAAIVLEKGRLYAETQQALTHVEAKNAELDSFVYIVSHDLKTPLVNIQGMAGLLLEDYRSTLDARGARYLQRIQANTLQMERLISDLLALSRVGREARPPETIRLAEVVEAVLGELAEPIQRRGVRVRHSTPHTVSAVRTQIEQVLTNLVSNAVKYLGDTAEPALEIGSVDRGPFVECYVRDNGIGIDPAYHEKVFELFERLKDVEAEGTGVGLPIVKKIVEVAGGRVWVESARGHGATFRFTWPTGGPPHLDADGLSRPRLEHLQR